jgi:hypothetical protein
LAIILVVLIILECGKLRSFEAIFHIKNFLKAGADEIFGREGTSGAVA